MKCPKCDAALRRGKVKGTNVELDQCQGCGGLWFDDGELAAMLGTAVEGRIRIPEHARTSASANCPSCATALAWFTYPGTARVVDACRSCFGVWLDAGEGKALRAALAGDAASRMTCPKCGASQPTRESCAQCGIIISRYRERGSEDAPGDFAAAPRQAPAPEPEVGGIKGKLLRFIDSSIAQLLS